MTTMIEKQLAKAQKDVEKYEKAVARYTAQYEKKVATCKKLGCDWTKTEWFEHRENGTCTDEQFSAYFEKTLKASYVEEASRDLEQSKKHLAKLEGKFEAKAESDAEADRIDGIERGIWAAMSEELKKTPEQREAEYQAWLKQFKAECLKDGIVIDSVLGIGINGWTASGKRFGLWDNNGFTSRSRHCYSLVIAGEMVFTSGEFSTAYAYLRK